MQFKKKDKVDKLLARLTKGKEKNVKLKMKINIMKNTKDPKKL